ncbi:MAG: response regulator [Flavobacteriaceae bacterium]|nr:response regulator [Flavobacteriaceae bacterium]
MSKLLNLKILIVEDEPTSVTLLTEGLGDCCNEILVVKDGIEAIKTALKNPDLNLILMDLKLPKMNGLDATKKIREFNKKVIIIAQTAYAFPKDEAKAIESGCNDFISKPILKEKLLKMIEKYLL